MLDLAKEAAALARWPQAERASALKRIIPRPAVKRALREAGAGRALCPWMPGWLVVWLVIGLGLFCRDSYRQIYRCLRRWESRGVPLRSTLCEARKRVGVGPLVRLARAVVKPLATDKTPGGLCFYAGLRLVDMDGFVLNLADSPANARVFGRPGGPSPGAWPQARVLALCEAGTHAMLDWLAKPCRVSEVAMAAPLLKRLPEGSLVLWDQGFRRFELVAAVLARRSHLLARARADKCAAPLTPVLPLADGSYLAKLYRNAYDRKADRGGIMVRVIDYTLDEPARVGCGKKHRLITTLLDAVAHPARDLVVLYHVRWEQELAIDEVKTHEMQRPVLRSQTPAGVVQEIYGLLLAHYVVRTLMHEASLAADPPVAPTRLSFTGTLKILQCRLPACPRTPAAQACWWRELLAEVARETIEPRRNRINPRVIKVQRSKWPRKRKKHQHWPQPGKEFRDSIVMLR